MLERKLDKSFAMKDLGVAKKILGMRITREEKSQIDIVSRLVHRKGVAEV